MKYHDRTPTNEFLLFSVVEKNQNAFRKSVSSCQNIMKTRSAIEKCLPVLRMHSNLKKLLKNPNLHYHALKMLEELSTEVLPQIEEFSFSSKLKSDLTKCRNTIKAEVNRSFKSYLESAWANAKRIGCNAMKIVVHTTEQYRHQTAVSASKIYQTYTRLCVLKLMNTLNGMFCS